jgi:ribosomal protein S18 acetylase RimI-like enzyme
MANFKDILKYNLKDKWEFTYLTFDFSNPVFNLSLTDDQLKIYKAKKEDIPKIEHDFGVDLTPYDRNEIGKIGNKDGVHCFLGEKNGKLIHYFLVYDNAQKSPIAKTPLNKSFTAPDHAYLGSAFTSPEARGGWVVPLTILKIFSHLKEKGNISKAHVLIHKDTRGAAGFYQRLGFTAIEKPHSYFLYNLVKKFGIYKY